ncbi:CD3324 family protein [Proteiniclasticum sp.]|uniref:CD3324 family protein n=1 Tax=Proteiniclasticum sp. TaxID=2053595 RepID=UPI00289BB85F|nr:CD3324 family protein [Proteiniclasticum sp.]
MSYMRAEQILPRELIELIQKYVDGENIYIPRKDNERKEWGQGTAIRRELDERNLSIYRDFTKGDSVKDLAEKYFLSIKSIQRILRMKNNG